MMTAKPSETPDPDVAELMNFVASVVAWLRGQEWVGAKPTRGQSADALEQLTADFQRQAAELESLQAENQALSAKLALAAEDAAGLEELVRDAEARAQKAESENEGMNVVISCCYDELKAALGRDIECAGYIPDAIKELVQKVAEETRERCAEICDERAKVRGHDDEAENEPELCAARIRALPIEE